MAARYISQVMKKRSDPGILLFTMADKLLYANKEAKALLPELEKDAKNRDKVLEVIHRLCDGVRNQRGRGSKSSGPHSALLDNDAGPPRSASAFLVAAGDHSHVMVLVERVTLNRGIDINQAKKEFGLTDRQADVVERICDGLTNKEISGKLGIGEYTVKDHIKKIMKKLGVSSRTGIAASLR